MDEDDKFADECNKFDDEHDMLLTECRKLNHMSAEIHLLSGIQREGLDNQEPSQVSVIVLKRT